MSSYAEKLKDPRWQRKRLEVMSNSNFRCGYCGSDEKTLHVHHLIYISGRDPWEYDSGFLECLCEECHGEMHAAKDERVSIPLREYIYRVALQETHQELFLNERLDFLRWKTSHLLVRARRLRASGDEDGAKAAEARCRPLSEEVGRIIREEFDRQEEVLKRQFATKE